MASVETALIGIHHVRMRIVGYQRHWNMDTFGHPRSEMTHMIERFRRRDFGHMEIELTIHDPANYMRPFTIKFNTRLLPDTDILESFCNENEKDLRHLGVQQVSVQTVHATSVAFQRPTTNATEVARTTAIQSVDGGRP
jgi:hypothetical protein